MEKKGFSNRDLSLILRQVAASYLILGENRFKILAYEKAAETVDHLNRELYDLWENGELFKLSGIGKNILAHIEEYFQNKDHCHLLNIIRRIPASVFELMKIKKIGPKKAFNLVSKLKLDNPETAIVDLYHACLNNQVSSLENFGSTSQKEIKEMIEIYLKERKVDKKERMSLPYALALANDIVSYLKKNPLIARVDVLGSLRRMTTTIGDIDILVQIKNQKSKTKKKIIEYFLSYSKKISVLEAGENKASILVYGNHQIDLRIQKKRNYGSMLQYFTGSKAHNIALREYALKLGYSLSEYGIKSLNKIKNQKLKIKNYNSNLKIFEFEEENELYEFLGLQYIPPELREGTEEIELAKKRMIPNLVDLNDIKGDLHLHSSYDLEPSHDLGANSYSELVIKAEKLNYRYLAFADHNPSTANHTDNQIINILKKRKGYLVQNFFSKKFDRINFFISLEVDILPDGKISLPLEALSFVDFIIVSVHSRFDLQRNEMTRRILKALDFPKVKILAHPTGRLINKRSEIDVDWALIFEKCRKKNIALEVNAFPMRLDLPDHLVKQAVDFGVKLVINTDSHSIEEMDNMFLGVAVARRGWAKKSDVINTWSYDRIREWLGKEQ